MAKTMEEIIAEIQNEVNSHYDYPAIIKVTGKVEELVGLLNGERGGKKFLHYNVDELTRIGGELSISQYNLIEYENNALKNFRKAKHSIAVKENYFRKLVANESTKKLSVKDVTIETESRVARYEIEASLHEAEYEKSKSMKFAINSILHRIDTRIKYLMSDNNNKFNNEQN